MKTLILMVLSAFGLSSCKNLDCEQVRALENQYTIIFQEYQEYLISDPNPAMTPEAKAARIENAKEHKRVIEELRKRACNDN